MLNSFSHGDWLLLKRLMDNMNPVVNTQFIDALQKNYEMED